MLNKFVLFFLNDNLIHKSFIDPAGAKGIEEEKILVYKKVRDELQDYFNKFFDKLN